MLITSWSVGHLACMAIPQRELEILACVNLASLFVVAVRMKGRRGEVRQAGQGEARQGREGGDHDLAPPSVGSAKSQGMQYAVECKLLA